MDTATFGLGCFWGPDAQFGSLEGVKKTRVGYAGGTKENPSYRELGDHTEVVQIEYNEEKITYRDLLDRFWHWHDPSRKNKAQYASMILYENSEQRELAEETKPEGAVTRIEGLEDFYIAEDYHQKYRLRHSEYFEEFEDLSPEEFRESERAAKMNAKAAGYS